MGHAEAVLLVDHHEAEVLEGDVLLQQAVGADHDVDGARGEPLEHALRRRPRERKRESDSMRTGWSAKRFAKVSKCCWQSTVVGASTATCLPSITTRKAARIATSVFP